MDGGESFRPFLIKSSSMKITIKQIIRWEQLRQKPFSKFTPTDEDDVQALVYCGSSSDIDNGLFETFQDLAKDQSKLIRKQTSEITRYLNYIAQFTAKVEESGDTPEPSGEGVYMQDVAMNLIYSGVDANYVMNNAEICDIPMLARGCEGAMRRRMEESRLWSYQGLSPYMPSEIDSVQKFFPFPWEDVESIKKVKDEDIDMAEAILGTDGIHLNNKDNG